MPISKLSHLSRWLNSSSSTWTVQTNIKYRLQRKVYRKSLCCKTLPQSWMPPRINNWQVKALVQRSRSSLSSWWAARSNNQLATTSSLSILNTIITLPIRYRVRGERPVMTKSLSLEPKKLPIFLFRRNIFSKILWSLAPVSKSSLIEITNHQEIKGNLRLAEGMLVIKFHQIMWHRKNQIWVVNLVKVRSHPRIWWALLILKKECSMQNHHPTLLPRKMSRRSKATKDLTYRLIQIFSMGLQISMPMKSPS